MGPSSDAHGLATLRLGQLAGEVPPAQATADLETENCAEEVIDHSDMMHRVLAPTWNGTLRLLGLADDERDSDERDTR